LSLFSNFLNKNVALLHLGKGWLGALCADIVEAGRTNSYVETVGSKADTLHRYAAFLDERLLKRSYELQVRKVLGRLGLKRVELAIDGKKDLYYGNNKLSSRGIKAEKGTSQAFEYIVLSVVSPIKLPLMAVRYPQGKDLTSCCVELLDYAKSLPFTINAVYFDRGFYIAKLIDYLENRKGGKALPYLIFVREDTKIKSYVEQTIDVGFFEHEFKYSYDKSTWKPATTIVVVKNAGRNKQGEWYNMTFATNLKPSRNLVREYKMRWNIETGFRIMEEGKIKTKSNNPLIRLFYFLLRCLLHLTWSLHNAKKPWLIFKSYLRFIEKKLDQYRTTKPPPDLLW
jgi:hypothetical protein